MISEATSAVSCQPLPPNELPRISPREFARFQRLILQESGIHLSSAKQALLIGRLARRLRELQLESFSAYYEVVESDAEELVRMLDRISTNETHFFREPQHFEFLNQRVFPEWEREAREASRPYSVRVWSVGCSTGEEPYSLAMSMLESLPASRGWAIEILATDLSTRVLERARSGLFPITKATEIPKPLLKRYMLRGTGPSEGHMKAGPEIQALVVFRRLNLVDTSYDVSGKFDLVLCRNVLIYFQQAQKLHVLSRLGNVLKDGGYLLLGHAETLMGTTDHFQAIMPTVYRKLPVAETTVKHAEAGEGTG